MSLNRSGGKIEFPPGRKYIEWKIPNILQVSQQLRVHVLESPVFYLFGGKWCLMMNLVRDSSNRYASLFVEMRHPVSSFTMSFKLGIKNETGEGYKTCTFDDHTSRHGFEDVINRDRLKDRIKKDNGTLEIFWDISIVSPANPQLVVDVACQTTALYGTICRDFQDLLLSGRKSDVTMEVRGHDFKAHRLILEACSPAFAAMFGHDMAEKNSGVVQIDDCDPDTFQNFLKCVYTGKMEKLSSDNLMSLYVLADKYSVTDIKVKCAELLEEDLSVDTACEVLVLADTYNEARLKRSAEEFLVQNMKTVVCTENWKSLLEVNIVLGNNVFVKFCNNISS